MLLDWKSIESQFKESKSPGGQHSVEACVRQTAQDLLTYARLCHAGTNTGGYILKTLRDISAQWSKLNDLRKLSFEAKSIEEVHGAVSTPKRLVDRIELK